jgi:uncharacterized protein YbaP (TraB family)
MVIGLITLFTSCSNPAQDPPTPSKTSVWEITKNGNSLFLGGSVHLLRAKDYPMPDAFALAFDKSEILVLEADVDRMSDPEIEQYLNSKILLPEGQTLQTVLDDEVYTRLERIVGGPSGISKIDNYKPSIIINELQIAYLRQSGFTQDGADLYYLAKSKKERKPILFLEDIKTQIDILGSMADGRENEYVSASLDELPQYTNGVILLISEWKTGEATAIEAGIDAQKEEWPDIYNTMIRDRNAAWMPKIEEYLTTEEIEFVIVGLAHLHGQDGLLIQLRNKGYTINSYP